MRPRIHHIAVRFALLLGIAAVLPLAAYGVVSILSLERGTRASVANGNLNVATRSAEEIRRYVLTNADILKSLAANLQGTGLENWQQDRILKSYVIDLREFKEITLFDELGKVVATSRIGAPRVSIPKDDTPVGDKGVRMSAVHLDEDLLPTAIFSIHLARLNQPDGWLVGEFSLEEMWKMVDLIRIGDHGFALVVAPDGSLIAHGDPDKKTLVAQSRNMRGHHPLVASATPAAPVPNEAEYMDEDGREQLAVSTRITPLDWTVIVEQPTEEAYAGAMELRRQLTIAISLALLVMIGVGLQFGRRFIAPIFALQHATQAVAEGKLDTRVHIATVDEFGKLGDAFNTMANRLAELQENVKRQERQAMFGRVVGGLFHDLMHPLQTIENNARLMINPRVDQDGRQEAYGFIKRELDVLNRFKDDVLNVAKPKPIEAFPVNVSSSVAKIVDAMRLQGQEAGVAVEAHYPEEPAIIEGDRFSLERVYRNLITNAIQATPAGGRVVVTTARAGDFVEIRIADTGVGIAADRLSRIFDDFVTTKRRGLGIGLAISKQIVEQLGGTIAVESEVGRGTSFTLRFPARDDLSARAEAS